jgi:hypothetical protein
MSMSLGVLSVVESYTIIAMYHRASRCPSSESEVLLKNQTIESSAVDWPGNDLLSSPEWRNPTNLVRQLCLG